MPYADPEMARASARRRYLANRDERIARATAWNLAHPEARAAIVYRYDRKWERENPEAADAKRAEWGRRRAEKVKADPVAREQANEANRRYLGTENGRSKNADKALRRHASKTHPGAEMIDRREVLRRAEGVCGICRELIEGAFHVDHIIPLARGGEHTYENVQPAHPRCNTRKGSKCPT